MPCIGINSSKLFYIGNLLKEIKAKYRIEASGRKPSHHVGAFTLTPKTWFWLVLSTQD
jgi:hypothetical protein